MGIIKIAEEGEEYTGTVKLCGEVEGQYGEQVKFDFTNGDTIFLPKDSADRQLARIPLTYAECAGVSLRFSRDHNPKKGARPYWGISLADVVDRSKPMNPKRLTAAEAAKAPPHKGPLPTQPFDEPTRAEQMDAAMAELGGEDDGWERFDEGVEEVRTGKPAPSIAGQTEREYLALFDRVAKFQSQIGAEYNIPVDGSSVQAATFSIWKSTGH